MSSRGHVAKSEYSKSNLVKVTAVGRRKYNGHSYVCSCCVKCSISNFKVISRRIIRRTYKIQADDD